MPDAVLSTAHASARPFSLHKDPVEEAAIVITPLKFFFKDILHSYAKICTNHNSPMSSHKPYQPMGAAPRSKNRTTDTVPTASVIKEKTDKLDFLKI